MVQIEWTKQARNDLESIKEFMSHDSIRYARITVETIIEKVSRLEMFP